MKTHETAFAFKSAQQHYVNKLQMKSPNVKIIKIDKWYLIIQWFKPLWLHRFLTSGSTEQTVLLQTEVNDLCPYNWTSLISISQESVQQIKNAVG